MPYPVQAQTRDVFTPGRVVTAELYEDVEIDIEVGFCDNFGLAGIDQNHPSVIRFFPWASISMITLRVESGS